MRKRKRIRETDLDRLTDLMREDINAFNLEMEREFKVKTEALTVYKYYDSEGHPIGYSHENSVIDLIMNLGFDIDWDK